MEQKKKKQIIIIGILLVVLAACAVYITMYYIKQDKAKKENQKIQEQAKEPKPEPEAEPEEKPAYVSPINFEELQKTNPDIYAWIQIPGTLVDYPILQRTGDNTYYLNHTVDGTEGLPAAIYTERVNAKDFTDYHTVIYGHNMKDDTMFGSLHQYGDKAFLEQNPYVYIYLPDKTLKYQIFASFEFDDRHMIHSFDYSTEQGRQEFVDTLMSAFTADTSYNESVAVTADSKVITLATCIGVKQDRRWLTEAVLIEDGAE